jgi:hypothetical protein
LRILNYNQRTQLEDQRREKGEGGRREKEGEGGGRREGGGRMEEGGKSKKGRDYEAKSGY